MMTPDPLPCSCDPRTSIVTTLGWMCAAAALIEPSIFAAMGAVWFVCGRLATVVVLPLSNAATVPAPMPPPTTAAVTAAMRAVRAGRDVRSAGGAGVDGGYAWPPDVG